VFGRGHGQVGAAAGDELATEQPHDRQAPRIFGGVADPKPFQQRQQRQRLAQFVAGAPEDLASRIRRRPAGRPHQRRLPDAGLTLDQHGAPAPPSGVIRPAGQPGQLIIPADQHGAEPECNIRPTILGQLRGNKTCHLLELDAHFVVRGARSTNSFPPLAGNLPTVISTYRERATVWMALDIPAQTGASEPPLPRNGGSMRIARTVAAALTTLALAFTGALVAAQPATAATTAVNTVTSITHDV